MYINSIHDIEDGTYNGLVRLVSLSLGSNSLRSLRYGMFQGLKRLVLLDLNYNNINTIENGTFSDMINLNELHLQENHLKQLNAEAFLGLESLEKLYLQNNRLTALESSVLGELPHHLVMTLSGNPLQCDRKLCWLKQEEQEQSIAWLAVSFVQVDYEPQCAGTTDWKTWQCSDNGKYHFSCKYRCLMKVDFVVLHVKKQPKCTYYAHYYPTHFFQNCMLS